MQIRYFNLKKRIIVLAALVVSFSLLTLLAQNGELAAFENSVYTVLARHINPTLTYIMTGITNLGSTVAIITIIFVLLVLPFTRTRLGVPVAFNAIVSSVLNNVLKIIISRDRPDILRLVAETGYGFPSGHAMNNAALYAIITFITFGITKNNKVRILVLFGGALIAFLIGASRIYLGVHNAGDVLAGWVMGVTVALFTYTVWRIYLVRSIVEKK